MERRNLLNCIGRMTADPLGTIRRYAESLDLDHDRVRRWLFARLASEPRKRWAGDPWLDVARVIERGA